MRVLVIADPHVPVPPTHYGGTERIVHLLCDGLKHRNHTVDLIAGDGSHAYGGNLTIHRAPSEKYLSRAFRKILFQILLLKAARKADIVITFGRPDYLWSLYKTKKPLVVRFANPLDQDQIDEITQHRRDRLKFIGVSHDHITGLEPRSSFSVVCNAVVASLIPFRAVPEQPPYLAFLGRITANKGVHLAIAAAREAGMKLIIAGNVSDKEPGAREYFEQVVAPELGDEIEFVGPVDDNAKAKLLGGATALLYPIQWREPFGIVMIEAMACGCPVIGWRNGSVPEVVRDGVTGFVVESMQDMVNAIRRIGVIDRNACREEAENRYSQDALVDGDARVFLDLLEECRRGE
jgi:glycosyltransferase involved in cell wall biosynthesis